MRHLHAAELRASWPAWVAVCLAFVVTNAALALAALAELAGVRAVRTGLVDFYDSAAVTFTPAANLLFCALVGAAVIGSSTALVVDSRRGSLARLALSGATPRQVVSTITTQLVVVSVACSLIGDALAYALLEPTLLWLAEDLPVPPPIYALWPVLLANLLSVGVALIGGYRAARGASRIPPVEALRQATGGRGERTGAWRWLGVGACLLVVVAAYSAIPAVVANLGGETFSTIFQGSLLVLVVTAVLLSLAAPALVGPVTRAWTALVPPLDPSWDLARRTAVAKATRLSGSVVPVMMTTGLLFGDVALADTMESTLAANGVGEGLSGGGIRITLMFLGLPLLIALSGSVGSLVMMSKQRDAELALSGIVGTTPAQRLALPVAEGVIITVTGALLSTVMVAACIGYLAAGITAMGWTFAFDPSWGVLAGAFLASLAVTVAATALPTLPSLRRPEPRVIARLVAA